MQENRKLPEICETLRARIAQLLDEENTRRATEWTELLDQEQIKRIRRSTRNPRNPRRGIAKSS